MKHQHDTTFDEHSPEPPDGAARPRLLSELLQSGLDVKLHLLEHYAELARLLAREIHRARKSAASAGSATVATSPSMGAIDAGARIPESSATATSEAQKNAAQQPE